MKHFLIIALLTVIAVPAWSFDWQKHGFTVESEETEGEIPVTKLKTDDGVSVILRHSEKMTSLENSLVLKTVKDFNSWNSMKPGKLIFTFVSGKVTVVVIPASFTSGERDLLSIMPAGMLFEVADIMKYNFRIKVQDYFIRINGNFLSEEILVKKLDAAATDPVAYLQRYDPQYIVKKQDQEIKNLRYALIALSNNGMCSGFRPIDRKIIDKVVETSKANPQWSVKKVYKYLDKRKVKVSEKEVMIIMSVYFNKFK
jgi:hypothetical protein